MLPRPDACHLRGVVRHLITSLFLSFVTGRNILHLRLEERLQLEIKFSIPNVLSENLSRNAWCTQTNLEAKIQGSDGKVKCLGVCFAHTVQDHVHDPALSVT